jgi:hypothetical protein
MPQIRSHSWALAKKVLAKIKKEITTSNDIIPFAELPFFYAQDRNKYIEKFGLDKIEAYEKHTELLKKLRSFIPKYYPKYVNKIVFPLATLKIAISMCGVGECDEATQRAAMELVNLGCKEEINFILITGKPREVFPDPKKAEDYYGHTLIVIGDINKLINTDPKLFFQNLPDTHVLLDAKFRVVAAANRTPEVLQEVFAALAIDKIAMISGVNPQEKSSSIQKMASIAKALSEHFAKKLKLKIPERIHQDMFFSPPAKKHHEHDIKPTSLLVGEDELSWNTCMAQYKPRNIANT